MVFVEGVEDVFEEDEAQSGCWRAATDAFCRVPIGCRHCLIGSEPELGLEAEIGGGFFGTVSVGFGAGHGGEIGMRNQDLLRPRIE